METNSTPKTQPTGKPRLLGPWRTAFQWLCTLAVLVIPFLEVDGISVLRLDFTSLTLHLAGHVLPIEALWLLLLCTLLLVLLFLLVTLAFGRAWCGWACPQTTLVDLVEWFARMVGVQVSSGRLVASAWQHAVLHLFYFALAVLVGANLAWYFIAPADFFAALLAGTLHWSAWTLIGCTAAAIYLDLAWLRRLFCKEFCPYGRFQTVLIDAGTLTLRYHPDEAPRCIRCGACVRVCPTGIDIRQGDHQIECINCGRCLDACRQVMARRGQAGIIRYTFGLQGRGARALINLRMALVAGACLAVTIGLVVATTHRSPLTLKAARHPTLLPQIVGEGRVINFFSVFVVNRKSQPQSAQLEAGTAPFMIEWRGPLDPLQLAGGERRRIDIGLETDISNLAAPRKVELVLRAPDGAILTATPVTLTGPLATKGVNQSQ